MVCLVSNEGEALDLFCFFHGQRQAPGHWCLGLGVRILSLLGALFPGTCLQGTGNMGSQLIPTSCLLHASGVTASARSLHCAWPRVFLLFPALRPAVSNLGRAGGELLQPFLSLLARCGLSPAAQPQRPGGSMERIPFFGACHNSQIER